MVTRYHRAMEPQLKVRIGFGLGTRSEVKKPNEWGELAENLERLHFDSLWFSERVAGSSLDPLVFIIPKRINQIIKFNYF